MLKVLVVDDDENSMNITKRALSLFDNVSLVGSFNSGIEAIEFIRKNPINLVFLDIEMGEMNGFEVASFIHNNYPDVQYVFVTGHTDFAVEGYNYQPLSFLVKPISITRLEQILNLAEEKSGEKPPEKHTDKQIGLHVESRLEIVSVSDVAYLETVGRKVKVVCVNGRELMSSESLKKLAAVFEDYGFFRCYQSFVVKVSLIESVSSDMFHRSYIIKLKGIDREIPLSRDNSSALREILEKNGINII